MQYVLYADESGTSPVDSCYTIGCLLVSKDFLPEFKRSILELVDEHNLPSGRELKWQSIKNHYGIINFMIDVAKILLNNPSVRFVCKVTWKKHYHKWEMDEEAAFYTSYTMLLKFCADQLNSGIEAAIDNKSDSYGKQTEVVQTIANHQLKDKLGHVDVVEKYDSKDEVLIQVADLFTGAINASHNLWLKPNAQIHAGKKIAISKLAECFGWDALHYDTFPNTSLNIWHFPQNEYRGKPRTMAVKPNRGVSYISRDELYQLLGLNEPDW
jgi:Protein of unknown function (DUF3800)